MSISNGFAIHARVIRRFELVFLSDLLGGEIYFQTDISELKFLKG